MLDTGCTALEAFEQDAYNEGKAFEAYKMAASLGNERARYQLGLMYAEGEGTPQDDKKAIETFQVGEAQQGAGLFTLAKFYEEQDEHQKAAQLYAEAVKQGHVD